MKQTQDRVGLPDHVFGLGQNVVLIREVVAN